MGNHLCSCFCTSKPVKLVRFNGGLDRIAVKKGIKVAEVMMDNPNQFVCDLGNLQAGHRIQALPAHEELKEGNTYVLLPMHRLGSMPSDSEMKALNAYVYHKSCRAQRIVSSSSKIVPLGEEGLENTVLPKFEVDEVALKQWEGLNKGGCRYWKPTLHTIYEFPTSKV
ncbi:uncharacterized protein LOC131041859 [Cryptomeria japonica]|uniref:uncharacterized protein LOC131041859 n=1 Tax=Cryptomeria japonica TaxID=3369 RepID=UPI0027D9D8F4|nr:uncharacterized protein LOC131041859 [Cryptomeria japonica]